MSSDIRFKVVHVQHDRIDVRESSTGTVVSFPIRERQLGAATISGATDLNEAQRVGSRESAREVLRSSGEQRYKDHGLVSARSSDSFREGR
jgi:hypothetical protein